MTIFWFFVAGAYFGVHLTLLVQLAAELSARRKLSRYLSSLHHRKPVD